MILSMTGYGKAVATYTDKKINVEVKSLNSKSLDLSTRIAPIYREKEMEIKIRRMKKLRLYLILIYLRIIGPLPAIMI